MRTLLILCLTCTSFLLIAKGGDKPPYKLTKHLKENFSYIPAGTVTIDGEESEVEGFYMYNTELTNIDYMEYLYWLKQNGNDEILSTVTLDTSAWLMDGTHMEPYANTYHQHPAYHEYPVVTISHEAAVQYCAWLADRLNDNPDIDYFVEARLPTREEWIRASRPKNQMTQYAWGGYYLRNSKGCLLANFDARGPESIARDPETGKLTVVEGVFPNFEPVGPSPAESFVPGDAGVYNLNGNVAEMVADPDIAVGGSWNSPGYDIRNESVVSFDGPSPFVGFRPILIITPKS